MNPDNVMKILSKTKEDLPLCCPPLWARTGHLQTLLGHLLPSPSLSEKGIFLNVTLEKETERIHTTYLPGSSQTVVYLFHGLGGSSEASYMQRTARMVRAQGHHVFLNNHRGCGMGAGLSTEPYHSGRADDLSRVLAYGKNMLPDHRHIAVGFSLSANALLLLAAGVRADVQPDYAIAVNGPINLDRASLLLQKGANRIYDKRFTMELETYLNTNRPQDKGDFSRVKTLRDFDEYYTAPFGGFKNRDDYYQTCSAKQFLKQINIPTVIITAKDDPFVSFQDYQEASYSALCFSHFENYGGHMGYLMKDGLGYQRWLDLALNGYIKALSQS